MSAPDERVWLRHVGLAGEEGHGGAFACPAGAVDEWRAMGWEPGDPPEEPNPVVAENIAAQQAEAARLAAEAKEAKSPKTGRKSGADATAQES